MAIAGRGVADEGEEMMPKGMLAMEKWESAGISSQDFIGVAILELVMMVSRGIEGGLLMKEEIGTKEGRKEKI